jgi:hypothetical protein
MISSFPQQLTKYFIIYLLYSHVSAVILGHHQVKVQNIKKGSLFIQRILWNKVNYELNYIVTKYMTNEGFVIGMMYISSLLIYRHFLFLTYLSIY